MRIVGGPNLFNLLRALAKSSTPNIFVSFDFVVDSAVKTVSVKILKIEVNTLLGFLSWEIRAICAQEPDSVDPMVEIFYRADTMCGSIEFEATPVVGFSKLSSDDSKMWGLFLKIRRHSFGEEPLIVAYIGPFESRQARQEFWNEKLEDLSDDFSVTVCKKIFRSEFLTCLIDPQYHAGFEQFYQRASMPPDSSIDILLMTGPSDN